MTKFIGEYSAKVDDKGRIVFPSQLRSLIRNESKPLFVIKRDLFSECLEMYLFEEWEKESEELKSKLNFFNKEHTAFWREYMRNRAVVEPDEKVGRISIPKKLLESININKEVIFCGNDHKIEIWAKEKYETQGIDNISFAELAEKILG